MSDTRAPIEPRYALTDHNGRAVTQEDFIGRYQLVFFGFTNCKAVCPRCLTKLSTVLDRLGKLAEKIQPIYITVDPERDRPEVMKEFLAERFPRFLGLTGSQEETESARTVFKVFARRKEDPEDPDGYAMPHTAFTYLLDGDGRYLDHLSEVLSEDQLFDRIQRIVR